MTSDVAFAGGRNRPVCQDYGLAGAVQVGDAEQRWAMAADGCGSEPHTDVGARLLAHAAARQIHELAAMPLFRHDHAMGWLTSCVHTARTVGDAMRLPPAALHATLLAVVTDADDNYRVLLGGDGVIAARHRDTGVIEVTRYQFAREMPIYPLYLTDRGGLARWVEAAGSEPLTVRHGAIDPDPRTPTRWVEFKGMADCYPYTHTFAAREYDAVAVLTDGAEAFTVRSADGTADLPVLLEDAARALAGFKGLQGSFVRRRLHGAAKEFAARGWWPGDDYTVAAVAADWFDDAPDGGE